VELSQRRISYALTHAHYVCETDTGVYVPRHIRTLYGLHTYGHCTAYTHTHTVWLTESAGLEEDKEDTDGDEEELIESHRELLTNEDLSGEHEIIQ
jgi:hypothetical protein